MQLHGRVVRECDPDHRAVQGFAVELLEQSLVERRPNSLARVRRGHVHRELDGLRERRVRTVLAAAGVAADSVRAASVRDQESVRPPSVERPEPAQSVLEGERTLVEGRDAVADVVVVDLEHRFEIGTSSDPDLHGRDDTTSIHAPDGAEHAASRRGSWFGWWSLGHKREREDFWRAEIWPTPSRQPGTMVRWQVQLAAVGSTTSPRAIGSHHGCTPSRATSDR